MQIVLPSSRPGGPGAESVRSDVLDLRGTPVLRSTFPRGWRSAGMDDGLPPCSREHLLYGLSGTLYVQDLRTGRLSALRRGDLLWLDEPHVAWNAGSDDVRLLDLVAPRTT